MLGDSISAAWHASSYAGGHVAIVGRALGLRTVNLAIPGQTLTADVARSVPSGRHCAYPSIVRVSALLLTKVFILFVGIFASFFPATPSPHTVDVVSISFGANDWVHARSLEDYGDAARKAVQRALDECSPSLVLLCGPAWLDQGLFEGDSNHAERDSLGDYCAALEAVASEFGDVVEVLDGRVMIGAERQRVGQFDEDEVDLLEDGVHPNNAGFRMMSFQMMLRLRKGIK